VQARSCSTGLNTLLFGAVLLVSFFRAVARNRTVE
jgi:hypothetical protein